MGTNFTGKNWIVGPRGYWQATSGEVKEMFGLKKSDPWPDEGMVKRIIQGFICWVDPITKRADGSTQFKIRAKMFCGVCGDEVPIGRAQQHSTVHDEQDTVPLVHPYDVTPASEE